MATLDGKSLVIIGGTSGLGLSAAQAFLAAGAKVVVMGRDAAKVEAAERELGRNAIGFTADASNPKSAPAAINIAVGNFQRFDGLYHVAGGSGRRQGDGPLPLADMCRDSPQTPLDVPFHPAAERFWRERGYLP